MLCFEMCERVFRTDGMKPQEPRWSEFPNVEKRDLRSEKYALGLTPEPVFQKDMMKGAGVLVATVKAMTKSKEFG